MPTPAFYWQLYIATYTALLGIPLLFFPKRVLAMLHFDPAMAVQGPFVHLTGMFLLSLTLITFRIWQKRIQEMVLGTVFLRLFIIVTLVVVGITGGFPFLYLMSVVVGVGVVGTLWTLRHADLKLFI